MSEPKTINPVQFFTSEPYSTMGKPITKDFTATQDPEQPENETSVENSGDSDVEDVDAPVLSASDDESGSATGVPGSSNLEDDSDDTITLD